MKFSVKIVLAAVSLMLSAGPGFAADAKAPEKKAGDALKADTKAAAAAPKDGTKGKAADAAAPAKAKVVDINSATDAELKSIPGIGDAYAAKIIAGRPYANKTQLKSRNILPAAVYEQVKDKVIAKQKK